MQWGIATVTKQWIEDVVGKWRIAKTTLRCYRVPEAPSDAVHRPVVPPRQADERNAVSSGVRYTITGVAGANRHDVTAFIKGLGYSRR